MAVCAGRDAADAGSPPVWPGRWPGTWRPVMMTEGRGFANVKAKADLGWQRQGLKQKLA